MSARAANRPAGPLAKRNALLSRFNERLVLKNGPERTVMRIKNECVERETSDLETRQYRSRNSSAGGDMPLFRKAYATTNRGTVILQDMGARLYPTLPASQRHDSYPAIAASPHSRVAVDNSPRTQALLRPKRERAMQNGHGSGCSFPQLSIRGLTMPPNRLDRSELPLDHQMGMDQILPSASLP
jgi:hypothetical protein